jgi:hypothetical protein
VAEAPTALSMSMSAYAGACEPSSIQVRCETFAADTHSGKGLPYGQPVPAKND